VAIVDDNYLYADEATALMDAFKYQGAKSFNWCKTSEILNPTESSAIHVVNCNHEHFVAEYLEIDGSVQYWDRLLFLDDLSAVVLHTAHDHIIYAGTSKFIDIATKRTNQFPNGWLSVIGSVFSDPELIGEYELKIKRDKLE